MCARSLNAHSPFQCAEQERPITVRCNSSDQYHVTIKTRHSKKRSLKLKYSSTPYHPKAPDAGRWVKYRIGVHPLGRARATITRVCVKPASPLQGVLLPSGVYNPRRPTAARLPSNPILRPNMDDRMGDNLNGLSMIKVPDWI